MQPDDWPAVSAIYAEGIATGESTFQAEVPSWEDWDRSHLQQCRLVATAGDKVVAWAATSAVSARPVYSGVVEVSVYVSAECRGHWRDALFLERRSTIVGV